MTTNLDEVFVAHYEPVRGYLSRQSESGASRWTGVFGGKDEAIKAAVEFIAHQLRGSQTAEELNVFDAIQQTLEYEDALVFWNDFVPFHQVRIYRKIPEQ